MYIVYYQYIIRHIQQINKISECFQLFFAYRIETPHLLGRIVMTFPKSVISVCCIGQTVGSKLQLPTILYYLSYLVLFRFHLCACQQQQHIIQTKGESVDTRTRHNVKYEFRHLNFQSVTVASDDALQGFGMQQFRVEPHSAFLFGG